jgi:hypothetical protein
MDFKSKQAYQNWLKFGHATGKFAATPGHQSVSIQGKSKKVKHEHGGNLHGPDDPPKKITTDSTNLDDLKNKSKGPIKEPTLIPSFQVSPSYSKIPKFNLSTYGFGNDIEQGVLVGGGANANYRVNPKLNLTGNISGLGAIQNNKLSPQLTGLQLGLGYTFENGGPLDGIITYKNDAKLIDGTANFEMISDVPISQEYNAQIRERLYSGKWGYNPKTGTLVKLEAKQQAKIPKSVRDTKAQEANRQAYIESVRQSGGPDPRMMGTPSNELSQEEIDEFIKLGHAKSISAFQDVASSLPGIETVADAAGLVKSTIEGDPLSAATYTAGLALPFIPGSLLKKAQDPIERALELNPPVWGGAKPPVLKYTPYTPKADMPIQHKVAIDQTIEGKHGDAVKKFLEGETTDNYKNGGIIGNNIYRNGALIQMPMNTFRNGGGDNGKKKSSGKSIFENGGSMEQENMGVPVTEFNTGGTHEENPNGGIPQGIGANGAPNLVQENEIKTIDPETKEAFIISDNPEMVITEDIAKEFGINKKHIGKTVLAAGRDILRLDAFHSREGDTITEETKEKRLAPFIAAHKKLTAIQNAKDAQAKAENLEKELGRLAQEDPEKFQMLMAMSQQQQGGMPPEAMGQEQPQMPMGQPGMETTRKNGGFVKDFSDMKKNMYTNGGGDDDKKSKKALAQDRIKATNEWLTAHPFMDMGKYTPKKHSSLTPYMHTQKRDVDGVTESINEIYVPYAGVNISPDNYSSVQIPGGYEVFTTEDGKPIITDPEYYKYSEPDSWGWVENKKRLGKSDIALRYGDPRVYDFIADPQNEDTRKVLERDHPSIVEQDWYNEMLVNNGLQPSNSYDFGGNLGAGVAGLAKGALGSVPLIGGLLSKGVDAVHGALDKNITPEEQKIAGIGQTVGGIGGQIGLAAATGGASAIPGLFGMGNQQVAMNGGYQYANGGDPGITINYPERYGNEGQSMYPQGEATAAYPPMYVGYTPMPGAPLTKAEENLRGDYLYANPNINAFMGQLDSDSETFKDYDKALAKEREAMSYKNGANMYVHGGSHNPLSEINRWASYTEVYGGDKLKGAEAALTELEGLMSNADTQKREELRKEHHKLYAQYEKMYPKEARARRDTNIKNKKQESAANVLKYVPEMQGYIATPTSQQQATILKNGANMYANGGQDPSIPQQISSGLNTMYGAVGGTPMFNPEQMYGMSMPYPYQSYISGPTAQTTTASAPYTPNIPYGAPTLGSPQGYPTVDLDNLDADLEYGYDMDADLNTGEQGNQNQEGQGKDDTYVPPSFKPNPWYTAGQMAAPIYNFVQAFGKADQMNESEYMLKEDAQGKTMNIKPTLDAINRSTEAGRQALRNVGNPGAYMANMRGLTGDRMQKEMQARLGKEQYEQDSQQQADAINRGVRAGNIQTALAIKDRNDRNLAAKQGFGSAVGENLSDMFGSLRQEDLMREMLATIGPDIVGKAKNGGFVYQPLYGKKK